MNCWVHVALNLSWKFTRRRLSVEVFLLEEDKTFFWLDINWDKNKIRVHQCPYIARVLSKHGLMNSRKVSTPLPAKCDLSFRKENERSITEKIHRHYRTLVGPPMYVAVSRRPDIMYAASMMSKKVHVLSMKQVGHGERALRYLKETECLCFLFIASPGAPTEADCDVD